jgi:predicted transcriptional regulator
MCCDRKETVVILSTVKNLSEIYKNFVSIIMLDWIKDWSWILNRCEKKKNEILY